jgi:hypothetical protein
MGHSAESAFALWATAQNLLKSYGPQRRIYVRLGYSEKYISSKKKRIEYIDENEFMLMQAGWIKYIRYLNCLLRIVERKKMTLFEKKNKQATSIH